MRGGELSCPAECEHFPFATVSYDLWLRLDATWMPKVAGYVTDHLGRATLERLVAEQAFDDDPDREEAFLSAFHTGVHHALFILRDDEGRTLADRWEAEGWRRLTNDERVMMRYRRRSFPTVVEVQRVLSDHSLECLDVLEEDPKPFILFDRATVGRAVRFDRILVWICHYPHFSRVGPSGVAVPRSIAAEFVEELRRRASEAGAATPKAYLLSCFPECCRLVSEVSAAGYRRVMDSIDAHHCTGEYDLVAGRDAVAAVLDEKPDFEPDDKDPEEDDPPGTECYVWLRKGGSKALDEDVPSGLVLDSFMDGVGTVGNVKLLPGSLVIETFTLRKYRFATRMVEEYFGDLVALRDESIVDLAKQVAERAERQEQEGIGAGVPEDEARHIPLEVEQELAGRFYQAHYAKFLDDPIPALEGMTPREAARDPAMRPRLVDLMKLHVHGVEEQSRTKGVDLRIDWVLEELGLSELLP